MMANERRCSDPDEARAALTTKRRRDERFDEAFTDEPD